jgi:hypothetical protein
MIYFSPMDCTYPPMYLIVQFLLMKQGFLYQKPVSDERAFEYVVPTDVIASHVGENDKPLLDAFLYNLKEAKYNGKLTTTTHSFLHKV